MLLVIRSFSLHWWEGWGGHWESCWRVKQRGGGGKQLMISWEFVSVQLTSEGLAILKWRMRPVQRCFMVPFALKPMNHGDKLDFQKQNWLFCPVSEDSRSWNLSLCQAEGSFWSLSVEGGREAGRGGMGGLGAGCSWLFLIQEWYHRCISIPDQRVLWAQCLHHWSQRGWEGKRPQLHLLLPSSPSHSDYVFFTGVFFPPSPRQTCGGPRAALCSAPAHSAPKSISQTGIKSSKRAAGGVCTCRLYQRWVFHSSPFITACVSHSMLIFGD